MHQSPGIQKANIQSPEIQIAKIQSSGIQRFKDFEKVSYLVISVKINAAACSTGYVKFRTMNIAAREIVYGEHSDRINRLGAKNVEFRALEHQTR